jgi:hypothetical protein
MNAWFALMRRMLVRIVVPLPLLVCGAAASAQPSEAAVKAAFLSKFAAYVEWPAEARPGEGEPIQLCLIGGNPLGRLIDDAVRGQQIDHHTIVVKRLAKASEAAGCHLAFLAGGASAMLDSMKGKPILTITDARSSAQRAMIHFVVSQGRVRFHIDEAAATRSGLTINSRLLALALSVRQRN